MQELYNYWQGKIIFLAHDNMWKYYNTLGNPSNNCRQISRAYKAVQDARKRCKGWRANQGRHPFADDGPVRGVGGTGKYSTMNDEVSIADLFDTGSGMILLHQWGVL